MSGLVERGRVQEARAARYLIDAGYIIVTRRFKARRGEIDLVAMDDDQLVFVEVKARWAPGYSPEASIGNAKRRAMVRAGQAYLAYIEEPEREVRFDLIAIDADGLRHHKDIFEEFADSEPSEIDRS